MRYSFVRWMPFISFPNYPLSVILSSTFFSSGLLEGYCSSQIDLFFSSTNPWCQSCNFLTHSWSLLLIFLPPIKTSSKSGHGYYSLLHFCYSSESFMSTISAPVMMFFILFYASPKKSIRFPVDRQCLWTLSSTTSVEFLSKRLP